MQGDENFLRKYLVMLYTGYYVFHIGELVPRASSFEYFGGFIL